MTRPSEESGSAGNGEKFTAESELQHGPVTSRGCTDLMCLVIFTAHIVVFWFLSFQYASSDAANPGHLYKPRDYKGAYCSLGSLEGHDNMIFTLNMTKAVDTVAENVLCTPGWSSYQPILEPAGVTKGEYSRACPSSDETGDLSVAMTSAQSSVEEYTTIAGVSNLLSGGSSMFNSITSDFNRVCVTQCGIDFATDSNGNYTGVRGARSYVYVPSADKVWANVWNAAVAVDSTLSTVFTFEALSDATCPYDAKYCVPLPGVSFTGLTQGYCTFEMESGLFNTVSSVAASSFDSVMSSRIAEELQSGIGGSFSTFLETWDVTIIVCVLAFVLGLLFLILLRFFIKPVVWIAVFAVFVLFIFGGLVAYVYSYSCEDDTLGASVLASANSKTVECPDYTVSSKDGRRALLYSAYVCWGLAAVYAMSIACLFNRIRLAVAINAVAAQFVYNTPHVVLVPVIQGIAALIWTVIWIIMCMYLLSQVPDDYVDTTATYDSYDSAYANCVDGMWPEGGIYQIDTSGAWMCYQPRYVVDYRFWYSVFAFFWHHAFIVAVGQCVIAGAVGVWFFKGPNGRLGNSMLAVCTGVKNCFRYHLGSLAFGSLILAVIQTIRWFMICLSKQAEAHGNCVMVIVLKVFACCLWCFEKSVKFLNKNAYIQVALLATNFCTSAKNAFWLIARNAARFGVLGSLGFIVHFIGKYLIMSATALLGFLILERMHSDISAVPVACILAYCAIGYVMGVLFMDVFGLAVDATLQCLIATEEMGIDSSFIPAKLKKFVTDHADKGDSQVGKHDCRASCRCCCF